MREERKVVTVLAADLVGTTPLAERLDPEEARLIVGEAVARMVHAVEGFGGTIKDLAGDGILALFGAPVAHEDDEERAVRAGLQVVQAISTYGREVAQGWGVEGLAVRVGINTGPTVLGPVGAGSRVEYGAMGDAVNTAARLQAAARPSTVLVDADTQRTVAALFTWGEAQALTLKGKADTVVAYEVTGMRPVVGRVRGIAAQARLVGRSREMATATEAADALLAGSGGLVLIAGEAGIGKSRLLAELRGVVGQAEPARGTALWLEGRCVSYGEGLPYWPYRDLLREWLGVGPYESELRARIGLRKQIERLFPDRPLEVYPYLGAMMGLALEPDAAARLAHLSPEALQFRTFEVVAALLERLAEAGPVVVAIEDLHWADATSVQLTERLLPLTERAGLLVAITVRPERDHPSWQIREVAAREFPHRAREIVLDALRGDADRELLAALVGAGTLPAEVERRVLGTAEGNPFFLEQLVSSLIDAGALVREGEGWRFDHEVPAAMPGTVERAILARIDRLLAQSRDILTAASVLGRRFTLPLLEGIAGGDGALRDTLHELQRLDLLREGRRWPEPEYRFKHALIQEAAYRTLLTEDRRRLHRRAAEYLEEQYAGHVEEAYGVLAHHWLAAADEEKAAAYLLAAGDRARKEYALDEAIEHYRALLPLLERRGEHRDIALVLFKLALALHTAMRFSEANATYQRAFDHWSPPSPHPSGPAATLRVSSSYLPRDPDPKSAIAWPDIQLCMQLFDRLVEAWPERTIVPSLAERWEIGDDGLRYVFHLREGLAWSDGTPLTAQDVEYGIKRVLDPRSPGSSVSIYFVLENGQEYYLGENQDADRIGVRALDDRRVEFRLVAPAPYFMSVMNRPDSAPQPRHAIERHGASWTDPAVQVVSGPFRLRERGMDGLILERSGTYTGRRPGNVASIEYVRAAVGEGIEAYRRGEIDVVTTRYTPLVADHVPEAPPEAQIGEATWTAYLTFDHAHPVTSDVELRRALARAVDRDALEHVAPANLLVARGGLVPPALQGHTPEIALRLDPEAARAHLSHSRGPVGLAMAAQDVWLPMLRVLAATWREVLGLDVEIRTWRAEDVGEIRRRWDIAPIVLAGWLPGYPDPEYILRLLLHSKARTNEGGFAYEPYDDLIERARHERSDRGRLALFHQADRMAVADRVAVVPLAYGRSLAVLQPWVSGWWEFGKSCAGFADLVVGPRSPGVGA